MSNMTYPPIDYDALGHHLPELITLNLRTGNPQIHGTSNDVSCALFELGGIQKAAETLGVEEIEIEHWADDHYVPTRYAEQIEKLIGWSVWSMQVPGFMASWERLPGYAYS